MTRLKHLLLGGAAALATAASAHAADMPVKAAPVEYAQSTRSLYGAGFFYIPGTDTCLKIGGYLRSDHIYGMANARGCYLSSPNAQETRTSGDTLFVPRPHEPDHGFPHSVGLRHDPRLRGDYRPAIVG